MATAVFDRVQELLGRHGISFQVLRHEPVYTSQQAADVRVCWGVVRCAAQLCMPEVQHEN